MKRILILALSLTLLFSFLMVLLSPQSIYAQDNPWFTPRGPIVKTETKITTPILFPYIFGHTSPGAKITINENTIKADGKGYYKINTTAESTSPIKMTIEGPHGGKTVRLVDHSYYGVEQDVSERVIDHKLNLEEEFELQSTIEFDPTIMDIFYESLISPAPSQLPFLPKLCPYFTPPKTDFFFQNDNLLFNPPKWQDVDDASQIVRIDYDGQNVLQITQADVKHDYEVLEEVPFGPISGIYSNFHFGVMPYSPVIEGLYEQCLAADKSEENIECQKLILAFEGHTQRDCEEAGSKSDKDDCEKEKDMTLEVLEEIFGSKDPNTFHRIHGFLMGPFYTRQTAVALLDGTISEESQCEWGDTQAQIPGGQSIKYLNLGIWDWDYNINYPNDEKRVMVLFWEGDDKPWWSDVIALFDIKKDDVNSGEKSYNNASDAADEDLIVTFKTGATSVNPKGLEVHRVNKRVIDYQRLERLKRQLFRRPIPRIPQD